MNILFRFAFSSLFILNSINILNAQDLFFSEFSPDGGRSRLEIFNPKKQDLNLDGYSVRFCLNTANSIGTFPDSPTHYSYFDLSGIVLAPLGTYVIVGFEANEGYQLKADKVVYDTYDPGDYIMHFYNDDALGLFRNDTLIDIIGEESVREIWDISGVATVTSHTENGAKTMIRKPDIMIGNPDWDDSRGYVSSLGYTTADSSEWLILENSFDNLGEHDINISDIALIKLSEFGISIKSGESLIDFGSLDLGNSLTKKILVQNMGDIDLLVTNIQSSDANFTFSPSSFNLAQNEADTLSLTYTPSASGTYSSVITLFSNSISNSEFEINAKGSGTSLDPADTIRFFISPDGSDLNNGETPEFPLRTIQAALDKTKDLARPEQEQMSPMPAPSDNPILGTTETYWDEISAHLENMTYRVEIHLLPGFYFLESPILIDNSVGGNIHFIGDWESGAEDQIRNSFNLKGTDPLWLELPVEKVPVVSGGQIIDNWRDTTVNGVTAWVTDLPEVAAGNWYFKALFVNGRRAIRSRFPKEGTFRITEILLPTTGEDTKKSDRVRIADGDMGNWQNLSDVEMVHLHRWVDERIPVKSIDISSGIVTLEYKPSYDMDGSHPIHGAGLSAYYSDHVFETMSEPGEWYLNRNMGKLFYIPNPGEEKTVTEIIAPRLLNLITIKGNSYINKYLWNISFKKIGFMHTESNISDHIGTGNANTYGDGAVAFEDSRAPEVSACFFAHLGDLALELRSGTMGGQIGANIFRDLGSGATSSYHLTTSVEYFRRTGYNHFFDNDILGYGRYYHGEVAMRNTNSIYLNNEHNLIRDGYLGAITLTSSRTTVLSYGYANKIHKNKIYDIGQGELSDFGGIYTTGYQPYSEISNNLVFNTEGRDYTSPSIYVDDNTTHIVFKNNILYFSNLSTLQEKCHYNLFENNIVAFGARNALYTRTSSFEFSEDVLNLGVKPTEFYHNIFLQNGGISLFKGPETGSDMTLQHKGDNNLFWDYTSIRMDINENQSFTQWQSVSGDDAVSVVADPLFKDPFHGDFTILSGSPTEDIGFTPIDMSDVGPRKAVWDDLGAVWINYPDESQRPEFLASDIPGLQMWISAKDLTEGEVSVWKDRTSNRFSFYQFYEDLMPYVDPEGLNGFPVVSFDGNSWMSSAHKSLEISGNFGVFKDDDFTIFTIARSTGDDQVVLAKAEPGEAGSWRIGESQNAFCWGSNNEVGSADNEFTIRSYRRNSDTLEYFINGSIDSTLSTEISSTFNSNWSQFYLGNSGASHSSKLIGDIAEILVYRGSLSDDDMIKITQYLRSEWGIAEPITSIEEQNLSFIFFPNPANEIINVKLKKEAVAIQLFDYSGKVIRNNYPGSVLNFTIPLENMAPGVHLMNIEYTDGDYERSKFIKK